MALAQDVAPRILPGMQPSGKMLLPTQWSLKPVGKQVKLGDFPVNIAMHPSEPWACILHAGYGEHEVVVANLKTQQVVSRVTIPQAFYGICFSPDGTKLFCSGGDFEVVHQFNFAQGYLAEHQTLKIAKPTEKYVPAGMATSADGKTLFVACPWGNALAILPVDHPEQVALVPLPADFEKQNLTAAFPYTILPTADGKRLYVSLWGAASVAVLDLSVRKIEKLWKVQSHPTEMLLDKEGETLFVACANSNQVCALDAESGQTLEVIGSSLYPQAPLGSTPNSIALSPDGKVLLIANADNNNLAVMDVSQRGKSHSLGFIPVGWYPTSVRFSAKGSEIYVANGKGLSSQANPQGPNPNPKAEAPATVRQYIGGLFRGTLGIIEAPAPAEMARYTRDAFACSPLKADQQPVAAPGEAGHPIPANSPVAEAKQPQPAVSASPIKYCLYIVKENRTYDQVFGDLPQGNGDKNLCIFPRQITPNHHALAEQFVLLDNFYVESEVSADGHEWSMAAYATDFVEKTWPLLYRGSREGKLKYPSEGSITIAHPASGYLWDRCAEAGVSYRSYGEFIANGAKPGDPAIAKVKSLEGHFDPQFHGYDLDYPDVKRAARFIEELKRFEAAGEMPRLTILRLPNDHTSGTAFGKPTPTAMVADNDLALGQVVEAISNSKFWKETAIFVVEDDAQNGSDHVDAHRTVALAISPYTKRKFVDSQLYSTSSMLRTMELILGLKPMTQFDAAALPMYHSFQAQPDFSPYVALPAVTDTGARNLLSAWGSDLSEKFDLSREDAADDLQLNEVIWRSVRGPDSVMPPPVRAGFVFVTPGEEEEDDDDDE